jgi:hypothetical protein
MVTVAGATASELSLLISVTVRGAVVSVLRLTVAAAVPVSPMTLRSSVSVRLALSSSRICRLVVAAPSGRGVVVFV